MTQRSNDADDEFGAIQTIGELHDLPAIARVDRVDELARRAKLHFHTLPCVKGRFAADQAPRPLEVRSTDSLLSGAKAVEESHCVEMDVAV